MIDRYVEPCAGMLAVGLRLCGPCDPMIAYIGGKRALAGSILAGLHLRSGSGAREVWIADAGPAGAMWAGLLGDDGEAVLARLATWWEEMLDHGLTERELYDRLVALPETHTSEDAAAWLVVAGWSYRAGDSRSAWASGSARALAGRRKPLHSLARLARLALPPATRVWRDARAIPVEVVGRTVVLIDPPYESTQDYRGVGLPREYVIALATAWHEAGAEVVITERDREIVPGWRTARIDTSQSSRARAFFEFATISPRVEWRGGEVLTLFGQDARARDGSTMNGGR